MSKRDVERKLATYEWVSDFKDGIARVRKGNLFGYVDEEGNQITEVKYNIAQEFQKNGLAIVAQKNLCGAIDKTGREVIKVEHVSLEKFFS